MNNAQIGRGQSVPDVHRVLHDRQEDRQAGLHVEDARPECPAVLLDAERHRLERPARPDRVEVAEDQGRPRAGRSREPGQDVVAAAVVRDDLDRTAADRDSLVASTAAQGDRAPACRGSATRGRRAPSSG